MGKKLLVIDANILSHALTPNQTSAYAKLFEELEKTYLFVVTSLTRYELLCNTDRINCEKIKTYIAKDMQSVELSEILVNFSAKVRYLYSKELQQSRTNGISVCDTVNAAYAIAKDGNCHVLTIDNTDYPREFFIDVNRPHIVYNSKKGRETHETVYILKPDMANIKLMVEKYDA